MKSLLIFAHSPAVDLNLLALMVGNRILDKVSGIGVEYLAGPINYQGYDFEELHGVAMDYRGNVFETTSYEYQSPGDAQGDALMEVAQESYMDFDQVNYIFPFSTKSPVSPLLETFKVASIFPVIQVNCDDMAIAAGQIADMVTGAFLGDA